MSRIVVIGIGSVIMKDDGIAIKVLHNIHNKLYQMGVHTIVGETDSQFCINSVQQDDFIILIDAIQSGKEAGTITILELNEAVRKLKRSKNGHEQSLLDLLALYMPCVRGYFIGVEAFDISYGLELSDVLDKEFISICVNVIGVIGNIVKSS